MSEKNLVEEIGRILGLPDEIRLTSIHFPFDGIATLECMKTIELNDNDKKKIKEVFEKYTIVKKEE